MIEKQGVIDERTPLEKPLPISSKLSEQLKEAGTKIDREEHVTKRLADKVKEATEHPAQP